MLDEIERQDLIARSAANDAEFVAICQDHPSIPDRMRREVAHLPYSTLCPQCGGLLLAVEDQPDTAPWLCDGCHLGFWTAELTDDARATYRDALDWGPPTEQKIRRALTAEWLHAQARGVSLRSDQLRLLEKDDLVALRDRGLNLADYFGTELAAEITRRG